MSGHGLQETLNRFEKKNDLMRRDLIHSFMDKMGINPVGPIAQVMLADYRPEVLEDDEAFTIPAMTAWMIDAFDGHPPARSA